MNTELKPCPFCGHSNALPVIEGDTERLAVMVHCYTCGGRGAAQPVDLMDMGCRAVMNVLADITAATGAAVEDWNMRAEGKA
jgi:Lar family restriction alleviation protein